MIKRNRDAIDDPIPIEEGTSEFDQTFEFPLNDDSITYFRYEIQDASTGNVLAFSLPLIFIKHRLYFLTSGLLLCPNPLRLTCLQT